MSGVRDDHTLYIFNNAAAHLQENPVRQGAKGLAGFGRGIGQGNGLGAAERGDQLLFQDIYVSLIADVVFFHIMSAP